MTKVTKERIAEIRARLEYEETQFYDVSPSRIGRQYCGDVAALLDALEEAQAIIENLRKAHGWAHSELSRTSAIAQSHIDDLQAENERLREALRIVKEHAVFAVIDDGVTWLRCAVCSELLDNNIGHADDCPFNILEDAPAQDARWNWHKSCRVCGMMFRKIDGVWTGNHKGWCDFAKAEGGEK